MSDDQPKPVDTSDTACAVICMLVSNPQGKLRKDGDGWQRRVNDLIRALRDERNDMRDLLSRFRYARPAGTNDPIWTELATFLNKAHP